MPEVPNDTSDEKLDELLGEIMMVEREYILSKRPQSQRRSALTNKFDEIANRQEKNASN